MNYSIVLFPFLLLAGINMHQSTSNFNSAVEPEEILIAVKSEDTRKFRPSKNMISINPIRGEYKIKLGQQVYYSASVHGSVGSSASAHSSNSQGLDLTDSFIEYDNEQKAGMCGGDSATKYFIFDAIRVGTFDVIVHHYFRGDLQEEYAITIHVEEK